MVKKLCKCFMTGFMMFLMMFSVAVPVEAGNGPSQGDMSQAYIIISKSNSDGHVIFTHRQGEQTGSLTGVSYNEAANTLTLNNVNMPEYRLEANEMGEDFKVNVTGSNSLMGILIWGYGWGGNVEIGGNGTLELNKIRSRDVPIIMEAEGTDGRIVIDRDVKLTAYKGESAVIAISLSKMPSAPVTVRGKIAAPLTPSADSGKMEEGHGAGLYNWLFTNDVISVTPGTGSNTGKSCTVTFNANGGTNLSKPSVSAESGKAVGTLPTVSRKNYTFKGWYTEKSGGTKVTAETKITKDQTLYAQWTKVSVKAASKPAVKKAGSRKISVEVKKVSGAEGYQITYSTSSKFKNSSNVTTTAAKKTLSNLKKGKTYYVKVRAYKTDSLKNNVYGPYSKAVKVKVK